MTVLFYTLGCKVNQYDTEALQEFFVKEGFSPVKKGERPDVVVINTCTVTAESDRKGRQAIRRFARTYPQALIAVTGCMPQARPEKSESLSAAHVVIGNALNDQLPALIRQSVKTGQRIVLHADHQHVTNIHTTCNHSFEGRTRAFVKIEDGCNRFCHYCLIPYARGRVRSKPLTLLKEELAALSRNGYREVVLAGINLTAYGSEWGGSLCDAVELAQETEGIARIRLGSMEPDQFTPLMIERLTACDKLCPQFHLSLQSGSDGVLTRMNRHYTTAFYQEIVDRLRAAFPHCAITTDMMCGYPGETDEEFTESLTFAQNIGFAKIHAFVYSQREGTPAATMENQVSSAKKAERAAALNHAADALSAKFMASQIGQTQTVLVERQTAPGIFEGHTPTYLPVQVTGGDLQIGQIVAVLVEKTDGEICFAKPQ